MKLDSGTAGEAQAIGRSLHISGPRVLVLAYLPHLFWKE
jgi:hypothetical protein